MIVLELTYLHEIARVVMASLDQNWTRDPFDRLIVSQTIAAGAQLVTADRTIREHLPATIW